MSTIKTWTKLLNERIGDMQITTDDDVRLAMRDHIDALTEALKAAHEENTANMSTCKGIISGLTAERDALQTQRDMWESMFKEFGYHHERCDKHGNLLDEKFAPACTCGFDAALANAKAAQPLTKEQDIAVCEGHFNSDSDEYFKARPQLDSAVNRRIFYAGHRKGWLAHNEAIEIMKGQQ
jgi:hypothetical protein